MTLPTYVCSPITYQSLEIFTLGQNLPACSANEKGENVIISKEPVEDGTYCFRLDTYQDNDWVRINRYYSDGTTTEEYER